MEYIEEFEMLVAHKKEVTEDQLLGYFYARLQGVIRNQIYPHNPKDLLATMEVGSSKYKNDRWDDNQV